MTKPRDTLAQMTHNPASDWRMEDMTRVADAIGVAHRPPKRGSHHTFSSPHSQMIVTVPYARQIKAPYVRKFVRLCEAHLGGEGGDE